MLGVDQALERGLGRALNARREIVSGARNEPDARTIASRQNAKAVVLDLVYPTGTGRRSLGGRRQARFDDHQSGVGTLTQRHGQLIGMSVARVELPRGYGAT